MRNYPLCLAGVFLLSLTLGAQEQDTGTRFAVAIEDNDAKAIRALLKEGAPADTPIDYGEESMTPLMKAAWEGDSAIVEILLEAGADVNARTSKSNETALMNAVTREHGSLIPILLKAGADIKPKSVYGFDAFTSAVAAGNEEIAGALLDAGAKVNEGAHGLSPLQFAASAGNVGMIRFLVKRGADVNLGAKTGGQTALLSAIYAAKPDVVKALIELKANVNTKTKDGDTPLKAAQKGDQSNIIEILKAAGAKK